MYKQVRIAFLIRMGGTEHYSSIYGGDFSIDEESKKKTKLGHEFKTNPNSSGFSISQLSLIHESTFYVL